MSSRRSPADRSGPRGSWVPSHREYRIRTGPAYPSVDGRRIVPCDRCGNETDADLTRYAAFESDEEVMGFALCPGCAYGLNTLLRAYVANRELTLRP
jgi:hypothetical protein